MMTAIDMTKIFVQIVVLLSVCETLRVSAQQSTNIFLRAEDSRSTNGQMYRDFMTLPPTYSDEALRQMINEVNDVVKKLHLREPLPINRTNIKGFHVTPPKMIKIGFGSVTTSNYIYYMSVGDKFSSLINRDASRISRNAETNCIWPIILMDTNAAYRYATQVLNSASVDVDALNRDARPIIQAWTPDGVNGKYFIPLYRVYWVTGGRDGSGSLAGVEFLAPSNILQQLYIKKSKYILRRSLEITNTNFLTSGTNVSQISK